MQARMQVDIDPKKGEKRHHIVASLILNAFFYFYFIGDQSFVVRVWVHHRHDKTLPLFRSSQGFCRVDGSV